MNRDKNKVQRLTKLGIKDFETVGATERLQNDMLQRLERVLFDAGRLAGLADCDKNYCSRLKCSEICQFGTRRRRLTEIPAVYRLLRKVGGPFCEVRVGRASWAHPAGTLDRANITAAKKLNRWALNKLYMPRVVAVGTFKVSVAPKHEGGGWKYEIHQIVSGARKAELEKAFATSRRSSGNSLRVKQVTNLGRAISDVLKCDVRGWQHPYRTEITPDRPKKAQRAEYYEWLLGLSADERLNSLWLRRAFQKAEKETPDNSSKNPEETALSYLVEKVHVWKSSYELHV